MRKKLKDFRYRIKEKKVKPTPDIIQSKEKNNLMINLNFHPTMNLKIIKNSCLQALINIKIRGNFCKTITIIQAASTVIKAILPLKKMQVIMKSNNLKKQI